MTRAAVQGLIEAKLLPHLALDELSAIIFGALNEAALFVATAENPVEARDRMATALGTVLAGLAT